MTEHEKQWTATDIANDLGIQMHQVLYIIEKEDLQSIDIVGSKRVFSQSQRNLIAEIIEKRNSQQNSGGAK